MKQVLITGSKGKIGSVLTKGLTERGHDVLGLDLPKDDISDYEYLLEQMRGRNTVIHVAHSVGEGRENWHSGSIDPVNVQMEMNVMEAALEAGVGRIIMASSVHADNFLEYEGPELLTVPGSYHPTGPYGAHKLIVEEIGRSYVQHHGIEFVGVRFGGVTADGSVNTDLREQQVWLSHRDLLDAVDAAVSAPEVPENFVVFYAVSNNTGRLHDTTNPFGWQPQDDSAIQLSRRDQ